VSVGRTQSKKLEKCFVLVVRNKVRLKRLWQELILTTLNNLEAVGCVSLKRNWWIVLFGSVNVFDACVLKYFLIKCT
jgi:hypothetical protein